MLSCVTVAMLCLLFGCLMLTGHSAGSKIATVLNVKAKELIVQAGQPIHLSCSGDQTLSWKFPAASRKEINRFHIMENVCHGGSKDSCQTNLTLHKAQIHDTGFYRCHYKHLTKEPSAVYIYVTEGNSAFVDLQTDQPQVITINDGEKLVIPCRVTSPNITVTLKKTYGAVLSKPGARSVVWDSKKGFIIRKPNYTFFGLLSCEAMVNGVVHVMTYFTIRQSIDIHSIQLSVPSSIKLLRGKSLSINCNATTALNSRAEIQWTYPGLKYGKLASVVKRISLTSTNAVIHSMLYISEVQTVDQGTYICTAKNGPLIKYVNTTLRVHAEPFINVRPIKTDVLESVVGQKSFRIAVKVRAFPPPEITWWKNNLLAADKCARYIINSNSLTIKNVAEEDAGEYTVVLRLKQWNLVKNLTMTLKVNVKPHIYEKSTSIQEPDPRKLGSRQILTCTVYGVPPPSITWTWHPCPRNYSRSRCDFQPDNAVLLNVRKYNSSTDNKVYNIIERTRTIEGRNKTASTLIIDDAATSGVYSCITSNNIGTERRDISFFVTDVANGFHITLDKVPKEGENMTLTCSVNKYLYTNISWILRRRVGNRTINHSISKQRSATTTEYSTILTATVHNATQADSGVYECRATNTYSGDIVSQSKEITITHLDRKTQLSRTSKQRRKHYASERRGAH
ncbi:PREDICTED: vascular endothelial growth factor receptor 1 [Nanorana parkeri]|uniref:vascular endothelial growth factor receptor 1 n=1 Tax=Nanorana parkeri TaxID=125878 RepID=UPI0008548477|nr:PREDICTED: vascular endothelial growth factor receptor 1 [Nanorana parkeri]